MNQMVPIVSGNWACDCGAGRDAPVHLGGCAMSLSAARQAIPVEEIREPLPAPRRGGVITHGHTVGGKPTREFNTWVAMRARCENPKADRYPRYGGRGIKVCDRWQVFENFLADMGPCPPGMTIDRKENDGDYEPGNCRWATDIEQANGRSNNRRIERGGEVRTVAEWARVLGIDYSRLQARLDRGWSVERALDPTAKRRRQPSPKKSAEREARCADCGRPFRSAGSRNRFCSAACRKKRTKSDWYAANTTGINERRRARYAAKRGVR